MTGYCTLAHVVKFCKPTTSSINAIAVEDRLQKVAVGRANSVVELYDAKHSYCLERLFYCPVGATVEALVFCSTRIFATGMDGYIYEFLAEAFPIKSVKVSASPTWCLATAPSNSIVSSGNEDGAIYSHEVSAELGLTQSRRLVRLTGRILSLCWSMDGCHLIAGSVDCIYILDSTSGRQLSVMSVPHETKATPSIVWSLAATRDFVIVSCDSTGHTSFWNGHNGTLIQSFKSHKGDVLAVCVQDDNTVYTAGLDSLVKQFSRVESTEPPRKASSNFALQKQSLNSKWVQGFQRHYHTHSVRALAFLENSLLSGGVDACLVYSSYPPNKSVKIMPPSTECFKVTGSAQFLLYESGTALELWKLGTVDSLSDTTAADGTAVRTLMEPVKMFELASSGAQEIVCCAFNADADLIAYSDVVKTRILRLSSVFGRLESQKPQSVDVKRIHSINAQLPAAQWLVFRKLNGVNQILLHYEGVIQMYDIEDCICNLVSTFSSPDLKAVRKIIPNSDCTLICCFTESAVKVLTVDNGLKTVTTLPTVEAMPCDAMFIDNNVLVMYSNCNIVEFNISTEAYTEWSRVVAKSNLTKKLQEVFQNSPVLGFDVSHNSTDVLCYNSQALVHFRKEMSLFDSPETFSVKRRFQNLLFVHYLEDNIIVIVQVPPATFISLLPPMLQTKKFGVS